jgi:hypothetical protein
MSPLPGLETQLRALPFPTAAAVGHIMTPAQAGFHALPKTKLTLMRHKPSVNGFHSHPLPPLPLVRERGDEGGKGPESHGSRHGLNYAAPTGLRIFHYRDVELSHGLWILPRPPRKQASGSTGDFGLRTPGIGRLLSVHLHSGHIRVQPPAVADVFLGELQ